MRGAFIAVADDGTAATFNPAGLAELRRTEVALVGFTETLTSIVARQGGSIADSRTNWPRSTPSCRRS